MVFRFRTTPFLSGDDNDRAGFRLVFAGSVGQRRGFPNCIPAMHTRIALFLAAVAFGVLPTFAASRIANVSVRSKAGGEPGPLIVGFVLNGAADAGGKRMLVRGIGPTLGSYGVTGAVPDPRLLLYRGDTLVSENDNWGGAASLSTAFTATGAFSLAPGSLDAALLATLAPGAYTTHLTTGTGSGIGLVECYDADAGQPASRIINVSARSHSGLADDVLTVGFTIDGNTAKSVLIRGIGPTLADWGVQGVLADPKVKVIGSSGIDWATNDNWNGSSALAATFRQVYAFPLPSASRDAAVVTVLAPGVYTAQVSGVANGTGIAMVEVYEVPNALVDSYILTPVRNNVPPPSVPLSSRPDTLPQAILQARPVYPFELRRAGIMGEVNVVFISTATGGTTDVVATTGTDTLFAEAAVNAVKQWRFEPARIAGIPVAIRMQVPIIFSITEN